MATTTAADAPVETGHDLILSTLLVHFDADEINQLPLALQPVVQDVYDVAQNLAETKVKYQREMAKMRLELERARAELATERSAGATAIDAVTATPRAGNVPVIATAPATLRDRQGAKSVATRTIATQTRKRLPPPPPRPAIFGKNGQPLDGVASPAARGCGSPLLGRVSLPLRNFALDSKMAVANIGSPEEKRRSALTKQPRCSSAPASTVSQSVKKTVMKPGKAVKSAPGKAISTPTRSTPTRLNAHDSDQPVKACLVLQTTSEHRLLAIQMKLNQLIQWKSEYVGGELRVRIDSKDSVAKGVRSHNIEEIQAALDALQEEATELLDSCNQVLDRVPDSSSDKQWLRDRQEILDAIVMQLDEWFVDVAVVLDAFPSANTTRKHRSPISVRVWSDVKMKQGYVNASTIKVDELREQKATPSPLSPVLTEFAVCAFVAQVIGVFSVSSIRGENFPTLTQIGLLARDLEWLVDRCTAAEVLASDDERIEKWCVTNSSKIFKKRHATSLKAVQRRATVCSEAICEVPSRIRGASSALEGSYASQPMTTTHAHFPASLYTWAYYDDMVLSIVSCHITLTRVVNVPPPDRAAALLNLIKRLDELIDAMAPWVDPRFADETATRSFEKREYIKLMDWCERMCGHVARCDVQNE